MAWMVMACAGTLAAGSGRGTGDTIQPAVMFRGNAQHTGSLPGAMPAAPRGARWRSPLEGVLLAPVAAGGLVVVAGLEDSSQRSHGFLRAFDAATGAARWVFDDHGVGVSGGITSTPAISAGRVLFGSGGGSLRAVELTSGRLAWELKTAGRVRSSAVVDGDTAWFGSDDGNVYAVAVTTGQLVWKYFAGARVSASPVLDGDLVYVASEDGVIHALTRQGVRRWQMTVPHAQPVAIAVSHGMLLISDLADGKLAAVALASRQLAWTLKTGSLPPIPAVSADAVCVSGGGSVTALDLASGKLRWKVPSDGDTAAPVIVGPHVLIAGRSGKVRALSLASGAELWVWDAGASIRSELLVDDGTLYFWVNRGQLIAAK